ncbi:hypothetical protein GLAREA_11417 [Glarea lozoyensis ATCC 20868]|uniref:Uncharacterized protein n=1 Tax=Glarea lozoyensis (strain ATCC 20868 / MF5171) TaxID=1116229 RepID=S3CYF5_GLAL2|nr:uncharacterized protein GLAREA_11417 [Glarea lozoyensis ATCC 20868]EPE24836.1 hypothetical protein GLAREA_11417 [Glarea lozoyensis ATCC 20868]
MSRKFAENRGMADSDDGDLLAVDRAEAQDSKDDEESEDLSEYKDMIDWEGLSFPL